MIVCEGLTALLDGKNDPSTTYKFSRSYARQLRSKTLVAGSVPNRGKRAAKLRQHVKERVSRLDLPKPQEGERDGGVHVRTRTPPGP